MSSEQTRTVPDLEAALVESALAALAAREALQGDRLPWNAAYQRAINTLMFDARAVRLARAEGKGESTNG